MKEKQLAIFQLELMLAEVNRGGPACYVDHLKSALEDNIARLKDELKPSFRDVFPSGHHGDYAHGESIC